MIAVFWSLAGLALLIGGAELLTRGGTRLALRLGISPAIVGLTVVAIGTSTPELAVGIKAGAEGHGSLAVGNIAGANIANILLILGLSTLAFPLPTHARILRLELPSMLTAAVALLILAGDGQLTRTDGLILLGGAALFTVLIIRTARMESGAVLKELVHEVGINPPSSPSTRQVLLNLAFLCVGIALCLAGSEWLVHGAVSLARHFGISDGVIGLTIVAIGTTSPEMFTALIGTIHRQRDIAVGNLVGSCVYNICAILGAAAAVQSQPMEVGRELVRLDLPFMTIVAFVCAAAFLSGRRISRLEGALFVTSYFAYLAWLVIVRT